MSGPETRYEMSRSCAAGACLSCTGSRYIVDPGAPGELSFVPCGCDCHPDDSDPDGDYLRP